YLHRRSQKCRGLLPVLRHPHRNLSRRRLRSAARAAAHLAWSTRDSRFSNGLLPRLAGAFEASDTSDGRVLGELIPAGGGARSRDAPAHDCARRSRVPLRSVATTVHGGAHSLPSPGHSSLHTYHYA